MLRKLIQQTAGCVQKEKNYTKENIFPVDVVNFEPDENHWHSAAAMNHSTVHKKGNVVWMEQITDKDYNK